MIVVVKSNQQDLSSEIVGHYDTEECAIEAMFQHANEFADQDAKKKYSVQLRLNKSNIIDVFEYNVGWILSEKVRIFSLQYHQINEQYED